MLLATLHDICNAWTMNYCESTFGTWSVIIVIILFVGAAIFEGAKFLLAKWRG